MATEKSEIPTLPGPTSPLSTKAAVLKQKLNQSMKEIQLILLQGREALKDHSQFPKFKGMYSSLERYYSKFEDTKDLLHELYITQRDSSFPNEKDQKEFDATRRYYYELHTIYDTLKDSQASHNNFESFHLPKLSVPHFNGELTQWPRFRDSFQSMVHDNKGVPVMSKFLYLSAALTGPASAVIAHLPVTADNYALAWEALMKAFENRRLLAVTYLNNVLDKETYTSGRRESLMEYFAGISENIAAFRLLNIAHESDFILGHLASRCLDSLTREQFESRPNASEFPTFEELKDFIHTRCRAVQLADSCSPSKASSLHPTSKTSSRRQIPFRTNLVAQTIPQDSLRERENEQRKCYICQNPHKLWDCETFMKSPTTKRRDLLKDFRGCYNCLTPGHTAKYCLSKHRCRFCQGNHHTLLHTSTPINLQSASTPTSSRETKDTPEKAALHSTPATYGGRVLLGTALTMFQGASNTKHIARIVVDSGSQCSIITKRLASRLGLSVHGKGQPLSGIGETICTKVQGRALCQLIPLKGTSPKHLTTEALVVDTITSPLPNFEIEKTHFTPYLKFDLADPRFWETKDVDFLLGADLFPQILTGTPIEINSQGPKLIPTIFGFLIMGSMPHFDDGGDLSLFGVLGSEEEELSRSIRQFWEIEEACPVKHADVEDDQAEEHFQRTHRRNDDGRYVVSLPFKRKAADSLKRDSYKLALRRQLSMERRFMKNPNLKEKYCEFIEGMIHSGHMAKPKGEPEMFLPHHAVFKDNKIRCVFDGSAKISSMSLNDILLSGPKLQKDIREILFNFRLKGVALVSDIVKMFLQILLTEEDRRYQNVLWRPHTEKEFESYELTTVTFGLTCSPFLAQRVLIQLVRDEGQEFPLASKVIMKDIYVDDIVTAVATEEEALETQNQLIELLQKGGFQLSKWASNNKSVLSAVSGSQEEFRFEEAQNASVKILGMLWDPKSDCFSYNVDLPDIVFTKRKILSTIAKIYDPVGFLSPLTIIAKRIMQELWKKGVGWDEPIPRSISEEWRKFFTSLSELSNLKIPRLINSMSSLEFSQYQLVGFSDASQTAFSATLYLRVVSPKNISVFLIYAKARLAPLKTVTIPRLELCGVQLLAQMYDFVSQAVNILPEQRLEPVFFTDSTIVLHWLSTPLYRLHTFVANRVKNVLELTSLKNWRHIVSEENPSDCSSRGLGASKLKDYELWWNGPSWLKWSEGDWPVSSMTDIPEIKSVQTPLVHMTILPDALEWTERFSSFDKMLRVCAWLKRFYSICSKKGRESGPLTSDEIKRARVTLIITIQSIYFFEGHSADKSKIPKHLLSLRPYVDSEGVVRVGGRLERSSLPHETKHPVILPSNCHYTRILVDELHKLYLHPGPSLLQALIRQRYWIVGLKRLVQRRTFLCLRCYKDRASRKLLTPIMSDLPAFRVQPSPVFTHTGLDFAGPFLTRSSLQRKYQTTKTYLCLFVCMTTKALHLELVSGLSTDAFLACLDRFMARRGCPEEIYSDCGTNFVGAARQLKEWDSLLSKKETQGQIQNYSGRHQFRWNFNPPYAPHFGGIWEAGVKSAKALLRRTVGDTPLTYEELNTLFTKIEGILNSRPLYPLSDTSDEFLTPGHFLIGRNLMTPPEPSLLDVKTNRLSRWQTLTRITQSFWKKWSLQYLTTLQGRAKWRRNKPNVAVGDLVLLQEPSPPLHWPLARIVHVHPGRDGVVRVVTVRKGNTEIIRPVCRLAPLLSLSDDPHKSE